MFLVRVRRPDGTLEAAVGSAFDVPPDLGWSFALEDGRWVRVTGQALEADGGLRYLIVEELPQSDEGPYDVLMGHAGARWRWIDVREPDERAAKPVRYTAAALPLSDLMAGAQLPFGLESSLAVFGAGFADTETAVAELRRRGYAEVLLLSGEEYGGYDWLVHSNLT